MEEKAGIAQHSTAHMAGAFARELGAQALVLTHFSGRYDSVTAPRRGDRPQRPRDSEDDMDVEAFDSANVNSLLQEVCWRFEGRVWDQERRKHAMHSARGVTVGLTECVREVIGWCVREVID